MGFFDKLFGGKAEQEETAKFFGQSKTVLTPLQGKVLAQAAGLRADGAAVALGEITVAGKAA